MKWKCWLVLALAVPWVCGFGWFKKDKKQDKQTSETKVEITQGSLPAGYALLFQLLGDESNVSKLLIVKKERSELHDLIKEISRQASAAHKSLEQIAKRAGINLRDQQLPAVESATRESIGKEKAKQLLGARGDELEFRLLLTQNEALTYASHLARVIASVETDPKLKELLLATSAEFDELRGRVMRMLSAGRVSTQ